MKRISKAVFAALALLFLVGTAAFLFSSKQMGFTGSRVKNPDAYLLDIEKMNGTDQHTLELREGDVLQIRFETVKGELHMQIKAPDGTAVYQGNGKETTDFTVNIPESGVYTVNVEARRAKGTIHIQRKAEASETEAASTGAEEAEEPWKTALAEELFQKYGVLPEYYEDLGNGIYRVYVEVGGEVMPFITVDSATGDYYE